jgi:hypothetical protein
VALSARGRHRLRATQAEGPGCGLLRDDGIAAQQLDLIGRQQWLRQQLKEAGLELGDRERNRNQERLRGRPIARLVLSAQEWRIWKGRFVVTVLPGRYLSDAASFCDARTAWRIVVWEKPVSAAIERIDQCVAVMAHRPEIGCTIVTRAATVDAPRRIASDRSRCSNCTRLICHPWPSSPKSNE